MNATALAELAKLKQGARATWAAGDFPAIAQRQLWEVGPRIVEAVGVGPGDDVLDVACGTGNAAIRAAMRLNRVHMGYLEICSMRPITPAMRSQSSVSAASCFRPAFEME